MALKQRHVFLTRDIEQARRAVDAALAGGVPDDDVLVVARPDIEIRRIHDRRKMADSDFVPAAIRGAVCGAAIGLVVAFGVSTAFGGMRLWALAIGLGIGAVVGAWAASLMGSTVQDPIRRRFRKEIDEGNVLVVIDGEEGIQRKADAALATVGARRLQYGAPSAMS